MFFFGWSIGFAGVWEFISSSRVPLGPSTRSPTSTTTVGKFSSESLRDRLGLLGLLLRC